MNVTVETYLFPLGVKHADQVVVATPSGHTPDTGRLLTLRPTGCGLGRVSTEHRLINNTRVIIQATGQAQVKHHLHMREGDICIT